MKVTVQVASNFNPSRRAKLDRAVALLGRVLNSPEFAADVSGFKFADDSGKTNAQILACIQAGAELLDPESDGECDLFLALYTLPWWKKNSTIGYGYSYERTIWMNSYWFDRMTEAEIAGNLAHEWCHKLGFEHDFKATARRPQSVPYHVGDLVARLAALLKGTP